MRVFWKRLSGPVDYFRVIYFLRDIAEMLQYPKTVTKLAGGVVKPNPVSGLLSMHIVAQVNKIQKSRLS